MNWAIKIISKTLMIKISNISWGGYDKGGYDKGFYGKNFSFHLGQLVIFSIYFLLNKSSDILFISSLSIEFERKHIDISLVHSSQDVLSPLNKSLYTFFFRHTSWIKWPHCKILMLSSLINLFHEEHEFSKNYN